MLDYRNLDWRLIGATLLLSLTGILLIMSAQHSAETEFLRTFYQRQLIWLVMAIIAFITIIHLPMRLFDATAYLFYAVILVLLVLVLFIGRAHTGATRWLVVGPVNVAPSDIAKLSLIFVLARFFAYTKLPAFSKRRLAISAILTFLPMALILKQPDLGTSLVFPVVLISLWYWSGLSPLHLLLMLSPIASLIAASHWAVWAIFLILLLALLFVFRPGLLFGIVTMIANLSFGIITPFLWNRLADYQKLRILSFIDPDLDPRGAGYQIIQSKIAIGSGGIFGKGLLGGSQTRLDFLPERHTDFIFSVLGEEFGLWGSLIVLLLFGYILYRAIRIAAKCRSSFSSHIAFGAASILLFQFLINVGMTLGFMPVTGLALPLVSYGGTSLVMSWMLIGLIVSADYRWQDY